jgi:aminocarboxymuconate-semialdehyde decarboxylase
MRNRREFLRHLASASAGAFFLGGGLLPATVQSPETGGTAKRRLVTVGGHRVKTVDVHAHVTVPEAIDLLKGTNLERRGGGEMLLGPDRLRKMDEDGIDVRAVSVNAFWYSADRDLARRLIDLQNEKLAAMCAAHPDRFVAFATVALQFPDLAAQQLEEGMKHWGLRGASVGGSVEGEELSSPKFDPFWAKAEELQAPIFMHPLDSAAATGISKRVQGDGDLGNVIGNPLETTIFLSHLIFEGTLDRFPNLKICCAHGGGFLPSYPDRMDHGCLVFPQQCKKTIKKHPSEYLKQLYFDSLVYTPESLRHLVTVCGSSQILIGTDDPIPWMPKSPVDPILATPGLSNADWVAMLGGTACKFLGIAV